MSTHTPGPWTVSHGSVYASNDVRVALMDRDEPCTLPTERDANARLIAAAPALLEWLKDYVNRASDQNPLKRSAIDIIRSVEGESNG